MVLCVVVVRYVSCWSGIGGVSDRCVKGAGVVLWCCNVGCACHLGICARGGSHAGTRTDAHTAAVMGSVGSLGVRWSYHEAIIIIIIMIIIIINIIIITIIINPRHCDCCTRPTLRILHSLTP